MVGQKSGHYRKRNKSQSKKKRGGAKAIREKRWAERGLLEEGITPVELE